MWISDCYAYGTVIKQTGQPRSYIVQTTEGKLRRNRRHLVLMHGTTPDTIPKLPDLPVQQNIRPFSYNVKTRSGRISIPPSCWTPSWTKYLCIVSLSIMY